MYEPINIHWIHRYNYLRLKKNIYSVVGMHTGYITSSCCPCIYTHSSPILYFEYYI